MDSTVTKLPWRFRNKTWHLWYQAGYTFDSCTLHPDGNVTISGTWTIDQLSTIVDDIKSLEFFTPTGPQEKC